MVARNYIHHIGTAELADMGGIYVLGHSPGTVLEDNVIAHVQSYHLFGWGVYLDEGASGVLVRRNLVHHTTGAGLHQHYGKDNRVEDNTFACARDIVRAGGVRALYFGLSTRTARVFCEVGLQFSLYEQISPWLDRALG